MASSARPNESEKPPWNIDVSFKDAVQDDSGTEREAHDSNDGVPPNKNGGSVSGSQVKSERKDPKSFGKSWRNLMDLLSAGREKAPPPHPPAEAATAANGGGDDEDTRWWSCSKAWAKFCNRGQGFSQERQRWLFRSANYLDREIPPWLRKHLTFYRIHFACFLVATFIGTAILLASPNSGERISFIDSLYMATSAVCVTGLVSVTQNQLSDFDKVVLLVLMLVGSQVFTSLIPVYVRRYYFLKYLEREGRRESMQREGDDADSTVTSFEDRLRDVDGQILSLDEGPMGEDEDGMAAFEHPEERSFTEPQRPLPDATDFTDSREQGEPSELPPLPPRLRTPKNRLQISQSLMFRAPEGASPAAGSTLHKSKSVQKAFPYLRSISQQVPVSLSPGPHPPPPPDLVTPTDTPVAGHRFSSVTPGSAPRFLRALSETHTWSGDTAQQNAKRLRALLEATKQQPESIHEAMTRSASLMTSVVGPEEDADSAIQKLLPGQRRYLELLALRLLSWLVPLYFMGVILLAFILFFIIVRVWPYYMGILNANNVNPVFLAAFQSVSAFANAGLSLFDDNLISFQQNVPYLLLVAALILLGNTMYAPTLRFILDVIHKHGSEEQRFVSGYLLDHPRKCYTHLFLADDTRWLIITVIVFNTVEFAFFCGLDWNSPALTGLNTGTKILDGFFQSVSTRNGGFNAIAIGLLSAAMLVLYCGMMYIAVYPVYITRQRTREQREIYDDDDIGVFYEDLEGGVMDKSVLTQGRRLFFRDSALVFLAIFVVCIIQKNQIESDPANFSVFNIIFEVISAYGNVGLSVGYTCPSTATDCVSPPYSFSGVWNWAGKLIIVMVMFLGRHRGLPDNIDAAIVIPGEKQFRITSATRQPENESVLKRLASTVSQCKPQSTRTSLTRRLSSTVVRSPQGRGPESSPGATRGASLDGTNRV